MVQKLTKGASSKFVVGLTGGFGTGKSTAARYFKECGAYVIDADRVAHEALLKGSPVYARIKALFKEDCERTSKELDRKKIAGIIFHHSAKRKRLEALVHPYVLRRMRERMAGTSKPIIVMEVPLLFEARFDRYCDYTVVVSVPEAAALKRLLAKGFTPEEIGARQKAQWPLKKKVSKADAVINNSKKREETRREVKKIWKKLQAAIKGDE